MQRFLFLSLILVDWSAKRVLWRAPGHVVIAEGQMKWTPEESATAKAFDSSKEKDTREESVMGQEKSAAASSAGKSTSFF